MSRFRLAMVTDAIAPYHRGGKEQRYQALAPRFAENADVTVFTMKWWQGPREVHQNGVRYSAISPHLELYTGNRRSIFQALVFALSCLRLIWADYDAVEADHMPYLPLFVLRLVTWTRRRPLVATWHESWSHERWVAYLGRAGHIAWAIERLAMRLPDAIVAASPETAERLLRSRRGDSRPIVTAPNGIDLAEIQTIEPAPEATDVIVVGRLLAHKRVDLVIRAVAQLDQAGERVTCLVVGQGPELERLRDLASRLGVQERFAFRTDLTDHRELLATIKAAKCLVLASEREGFGIAALEALACGTPAITTTAPDNHASELVARSDKGILTEPTSEGIAAALRSVLASPPVRGSEPWIAAYDWDATASKVWSVVQQVATHRRGVER